MNIAAVSGGPDSMALLEWMRLNQKNPVVCHVNYHHRPTASRDEAVVRAYCSRHQIPLLILHAGNPAAGNFQSWARCLRYDFFEACAKALNIQDVYTAHHQDDLLETWLMQKERKGIVELLGLAQESKYGAVRIMRPFLNFTKKELEDFCRTHQIPYGIDESNLSNEYRRNQIRHETIELLDDKQRTALLEQYEQEQKTHQKQSSQVLSLMNLPADQMLNHPSGWRALDLILYPYTHLHLPKKHLVDLQEKLRSGKMISLSKTKSTPIVQDLHLQLVRDQLIVRPAACPVPFWIVDEKQLQAMTNDGYHLPGWDVHFSSQGENRQRFSAGADDFPLLIDSAKSGDSLELKFGSKKISRIFIDLHIPKIDRAFQPVIKNSLGQCIFVNQYGCALPFFTGRAVFHMIE